MQHQEKIEATGDETNSLQQGAGVKTTSCAEGPYTGGTSKQL